MYNQKRIVITGMGVVTSIGQNVQTFFDNAIKGTVSISDVTAFDVSQMRSCRGGEIHDFDVSEQDVTGRAKQFALAAARECLVGNQALLQHDPFRVGIALGFTLGETTALEGFCDHFKAGEQALAQASFSDYAPKLIAQTVARELSIYGPNYTIGQACSAGNFCTGLALDALCSGEVDAMLVGGTDAFSRYCYAGFSRLGAIAGDTPRPFSAHRQGMVPAEGAGILLVETLASAQRRGATIFAEIVGYGESSDAHHITQPSIDGIEQAMRMALDSAGIEAELIDYISAHGTGTLTSDRAESMVLQRIYPDKIPPLSSVKSMIGHTMGAAASIECVATIQAMQQQIIPPTMSFLEADPECPVDCVPNQARPAEIRYAMKTASAFGGQNSVIIFRQWNHQETAHAV
ncbi:beta-ketoacyl-[acyl-carrier-protein] synthase family protein [Gynuella sunshinyii]|uniref:3-oxoacyl-(Acyl-carrier-protein) synthase n=1 Tax=Gynuella sunshinyii YC6258 TaxID=1445510 RepID=A0A0C5VUT3_9GAMM|nr:beta-ketoacyl-[acyl-carrier-protein] synthase family protein [Gynuella sunshinyii]AJQ97063.1 3-oxoacyl-(acyl-carrier-protein) synthase [Gynuella sunshinyii YC6258]